MEHIQATSTPAKVPVISKYHETFGKHGGDLNFATNYVTQSISNGSANPMDHNVLEYGASLFVGKASITNHAL